MQRMASLLIAERVMEDARLLVLGAGGGLEMKVFADAHPGWTFDGVDPSAEMLTLAENTLGTHASRANLHKGYIEDAPAGPFDAATCLLTLHFIKEDERCRTLAEMRRRLKPGSPLVVAHFSFPQQDEAERALWLSRHTSFLIDSGIDSAKAEETRAAIDTQLNLLKPEQDEALLREAGFTNISMFYAAFAFRGWVAYA